MPKIMQLSPAESVFTNLKYDMLISTLYGDCKSYAKESREFARLALKDFETAMASYGPKGNVRLFSREGLRTLKVILYDIFRVKTKEEKELMQRVKIFKAKPHINMRRI